MLWLYLLGKLRIINVVVLPQSAGGLLASSMASAGLPGASFCGIAAAELKVPGGMPGRLRSEARVAVELRPSRSGGASSVPVEDMVEQSEKFSCDVKMAGS